MNPLDLLAIEHPISSDPSAGQLDYFYENVSKHLIKDVIKIMSNGIPIDLAKVAELETTVTNVLDDVTTRLASNSVIQDFQAFMYPKKFKAFKDELELRKRPISYYIKEYKGTIPHRTYVVNTYLESIDSPHAGKDKWTVKDLKGLNIILEDPIITSIIKGELDDELAKAGMLAMAKAKLEVYNRSIDTKVVDEGTQENLLPPFNPASSTQKKELFDWLGVEALSTSKTSGEASFPRSDLEIMLKTESREEVKEVLQAFIDHSFSAIIKNNFIASFKRFTIDGILYGNIKLFGAKSFRLTSNSPNMLQMPSTGSIYAKPLKDCLVAPPGYIVASADFGQLEERTLASLSNDESKCAIFEDGLDSHCFNALIYFKDEISEHMEITGNSSIDAKLFKKLCSTNKELKAIRQKSKPINFKLNYQGMADADKGGNITQEIYDNYHNVLYKQVGEFRDEMVTKAKEQGYVHLGLGCRLYSSEPSKDYRTLFNAYGGQFWSLLTLLTINKIHSMLDDLDMNDDIKCIATIYDSIYFLVKEDATTLKWLNDNLIELMTRDFLVDQRIKNVAELVIGRRWSEEVEVPNKATEEDIKNLLLTLSL